MNNYKMIYGKIFMSCVLFKLILEKEGNLNYKGINIFVLVFIIVWDNVSGFVDWIMLNFVFKFFFNNFYI